MARAIPDQSRIDEEINTTFLLGHFTRLLRSGLLVNVFESMDETVLPTGLVNKYTDPFLFSKRFLILDRRMEISNH